MILIKYFSKEVCKNQSIILMLLFLVCLCQKLVKILSIDNNFSLHLIFMCLMLHIPELIKLTIPFSLFLSVLVTCYRLHIQNEILAMYVCSVNKYVFIRGLFYHSIFIVFVAIINISWLLPYCEVYRNNMLYEMKKNVHSIPLIEKKFQFLPDKNTVIFVNNIENMVLKDIFIVHKNNVHGNVLNIITADVGNFHVYSNSVPSIVLNSGIYYEIHHNRMNINNIYVAHFSKYHAMIDDVNQVPYPSNISVEYMFINQLLFSSLSKARVELHWRITLVLSIFIMPIIALLLMLKIKKDYLLNFLFALALYVCFFALHILLRSYDSVSSADIVIFMWIINGIFLCIILIMNIWDSYIMRYFRNISIFFFNK